jgi:hypothetical protein
MKKLITILILAILAGCYYDNEEELYPEQPNDCDTVNVTFSVTIWPMINGTCTSCHSGSAPQGNVLLEDYTTIAAAAAIPAGTYGSLYGVISHASGNSPMPKNGTQFSDCKIKQVKAWIDAGRPDN